MRFARSDAAKSILELIVHDADWQCMHVAVQATWTGSALQPSLTFDRH
jgi:hypothetical protein